jgi:hypothetical protein
VAAFVKATPSDRAPGPDGFTGAFFKAAWEVIGPDVVRVFNAFWDLDHRSFNHLNEAAMVLIHKTDAPASLRDYRPISLIHSVGKLIAKGLAIRLAPFMTSIVKPNQSAFIRGRQIHENFRTVQLTCKWLHGRRHPAMLLKVDLSKAFDTVAWPFLLETLAHIGFPLRWRDWLSTLLGTSSTRVLVNGRPGRRIHHARGLRQGDPLSPLLFVIVMDVLNALILEADRRAALHPLPGNVITHRASVYADDLVIFLSPEVDDFVCMRQILDLFAGASGLSCNVDKCTITPIHCTAGQIQDVLEVFPCAVQEFPARYLGAPLSVSRLRRGQEQLIVDTISARIPTWKAGLLNAAGRTTLTQTTLSAIPVHVSICCSLSAWAIGEIDKRRRAFLWAGTQSVAGGKCKVSWPVVCSPKDLGGLGLPDLRTLGYALRLRWEWKRRTDPSVAWALIPHKPEPLVHSMFQASVSIQIGDGASARFWTDSWLHTGPLCQFAPNLFQAIGQQRRGRSVRDALTDRQWTRDITGALTVAVILEFLQVWDLVDALNLSPHEADRFIWKWTADGSYSASSAYRAFFMGRMEMEGAMLAWKAMIPPKMKFFFWLALHGRLWTAERRRRHGLQAEAACALCSQHDETIDHLLIACVFPREIWSRLLLRAGLLHLAPTEGSALQEWWISSRKQIPIRFRRAFDSVVIVVSWNVWKERNSRTFDGRNRTTAQVCDAILDEIRDCVAAGFNGLDVFAADGDGAFG